MRWGPGLLMDVRLYGITACTNFRALLNFHAKRVQLYSLYRFTC